MFLWIIINIIIIIIITIKDILIIIINEACKSVFVIIDIRTGIKRNKCKARPVSWQAWISFGFNRLLILYTERRKEEKWKRDCQLNWNCHHLFKEVDTLARSTPSFLSINQKRLANVIFASKLNDDVIYFSETCEQLCRQIMKWIHTCWRHLKQIKVN